MPSPDVRRPIETTRVHHIAYRVDLWHGGVIVAVYVLATCGSMLLCKHSHVRWYGAIDLAAVWQLGWLSKSGFVSLWCLWAAITSLASLRTCATHHNHRGQRCSPAPSQD